MNALLEAALEKLADAGMYLIRYIWSSAAVYFVLVVSDAVLFCFKQETFAGILLVGLIIAPVLATLAIGSMGLILVRDNSRRDDLS